MSDFSAQTLFSQIDEKWPERNKSSDFVSLKQISFHSNLDGKKTTTKVFIDDLLHCVKNGLDNNRIVAIIYKNQRASSEQKNRFWAWESINFNNDDIIHIYFNEQNFHETEDFDITIIKKSKQKKKVSVEFPGIKSLQYKRKNKHVKKMQNKLNQKGFFISEKELGYYGKETCEAVKDYYRRVLGINSGTIIKDGKKFGPKAWERLFS
jgi:hypothetical protein